MRLEEEVEEDDDDDLVEGALLRLEVVSFPDEDTVLMLVLDEPDVRTLLLTVVEDRVADEVLPDVAVVLLPDVAVVLLLDEVLPDAAAELLLDVDDAALEEDPAVAAVDVDEVDLVVDVDLVEEALLDAVETAVTFLAS